MSWTSDGRLLLRSKTSGNWDIWSIDPETAGRRQVTFDAHSDLHPSTVSNSRFIVFSSDRAGRFHIWRMQLDGRNAVQLTDEDEEVYPQPSPDGRWVVYQRGFSSFRKLTLWKVPIEGGRPVRLTDYMSLRPAISPDGSLVAHFFMDAEKWRIAATPIAGGPPVRTFDIPPSVGSRVVRWTPDGSAVA